MIPPIQYRPKKSPKLGAVGARRSPTDSRGEVAKKTPGENSQPLSPSCSSTVEPTAHNGPVLGSTPSRRSNLGEGEACGKRGHASTTITKVKRHTQRKSAPKSYAPSDQSNGPHGSKQTPISVTSADGDTSETNETQKVKFDRNAYQAKYMREIYRPSKKLGITPEEYRARKSKGESK